MYMLDKNNIYMYTEHEGNACELLLDMQLKYSQVQIFKGFVSSNGALFLSEVQYAEWSFLLYK